MKGKPTPVRSLASMWLSLVTPRPEVDDVKHDDIAPEPLPRYVKPVSPVLTIIVSSEVKDDGN